MAASALCSHLLRRSRQSSCLRVSIVSLARVSQPPNPNRHPSPQPELPSSLSPPPPFHTFRRTLTPVSSLGAFHSHSHSLSITLSRPFSTTSSDDSEIERFGFDPGSESQSESELLNEQLGKVIEDFATGGTSGEDSIFPVRAVIWMLDGYHQLTGLPWWFIIASSTLALRMVLLPVLILQLHKLKMIGKFLPKLPPPFPPPLSGRSYIDQLSLFRKERKAVGCPTLLWLLVYLSVQIPCFFLWMVSIRRMSLDGHPGFNCGGALWFQNLTELPHGWSGFIFPCLIAGLHIINVQISFQKSLVGKATGTFAQLAKYYKGYLYFLTVPVGLTGFCIPQGSLLYWVTNSSLNIIQQLALKHPAVLQKLGLPDKNNQNATSEEIVAPKMNPFYSMGLHDKNSPTAVSEEIGSPKTIPYDLPEKWVRIPIEDLSPKELTELSIPFLNNGDNESAMPLLKLALDKDPEYVRALVLMGRNLLLKQLNAEAKEYLERAISKLSLAGHPTKVEDVDLLILASQWAGVACERQGKRTEGLVHFERIANMEEPEDPACKAHYFHGLLLLASALFDSDRKDEAAKYLRLLVAYNPAYTKFLEQCERDDDIASDVASSRREL